MYAVEIPEWSRMVATSLRYYVDPTPVSWHKVAKTGAISDQWGSTSSRTHFFDIILLLIWLDGHPPIWECCSRWNGSGCYAYPSVRVRNWYIYPGIALCAVSPTISSFTTIMILRSDRVKVLHPLNAIFYMIILYWLDTTIYSVYYYIVDSLTDP